MTTAPKQRLTAWIHGQVQGVGFRWWTRSKALELGLSGYAKNYPDGRVYILAQGSAESCQKLLDLLNSTTTPGKVDLVMADFSLAKEHIDGFSER